MPGLGIDGCSDAGGSSGRSEVDTDTEVDGTDEESESGIGEDSSAKDDSDEQHSEGSDGSQSDDPSTDRGADSSSDDSSSIPSSDAETFSDSGMTTESEMSTWEEHVQRHGESHNCGRCRYKRNVHRWRREFVFETHSGDHRSWLEQKRGGAGPWAIGCRVCRLACMKSKWAKTDVSGDRVGPRMLRKHAKSRPHARAVDILLKGPAQDAEVATLCTAEDRCDVPGFAMCFAAYKGALKGSSFVDYTEDLDFAEMAGAKVMQSRRSRMTARQLVECFADVLCAEDRALLSHSTHIHLTMDGRRNNLVVRCRMTLRSLPEGCVRDVDPASGGDVEGKRILRNIGGKNFLRADRLLLFTRLEGCVTTMDLADALVDALRRACGGEGPLWEEVRRKVFAFTPDGAYDEQLAGRLTGAALGGEAPAFPNLRAVLRCSAHAFQGAMKAGWGADDVAGDITKLIVQEVAKYIRSSDRFASRLREKARDEAIEALQNRHGSACAAGPCFRAM